ncbi:unnamed protein product, partial [Urochloa humidicola]
QKKKIIPSVDPVSSAHAAHTSTRRPHPQAPPAVVLPAGSPCRATPPSPWAPRAVVHSKSLRIPFVSGTPLARSLSPRPAPPTALVTERPQVGKASTHRSATDLRSRSISALVKPMAPLASMAARVALRVSARSGNVVVDLILGSSFVVAVRLQSKLTVGASPKRPMQSFGCAHHGAHWYTHSSYGVNSVADQPEDFVAEEKDLVSDVAIWAMYHRWCKHFKIERDHEDMIRRFANFKECVFRVHQVNRAGLSYQLAITERADAPWPKKYAKGYISSMEQLPSDVACARFKAGLFSMDSGPSAED